MMVTPKSRQPISWHHLAKKATFLILSSGIALILSLFFPLRQDLRLILVLIVAIGFSLLINRFQVLQFVSKSQEYYLTFLAFLSSRLSMGETLDKAFLNYIQEQSRLGIARKDPAYWSGLSQTARQISLRGNLSQALQVLLESFPSPPMKPVLLALPKLSEMGGRLDRFVRDSHQSLLEFLTLEKEVRAENSQKIAEAWILALMPFAIASGSVLMIPVQDRTFLIAEPKTQAVYAIIYLTSCLALAMTGLISQNSPASVIRSKSLPTAIRRKGRDWDKWSHTLTKAYQSPALNQITRPVFSALSQFPEQSNRYFQDKFFLSVGALGIAAIWFAAKAIPFPVVLVAPAIVSIAQDFKLLRSKKHLDNQYRVAYPLFLTWLVNGLVSGFSVTRVLREAGDLWRSSQSGNRLCQDLEYFRQQSDGGRPSYWISEQLALRSPVPEIQAFWHGLSRYEREGSSELLNLLVLMAANSRQLLRTGRRQELEEKSLRLLLPMMLNLINVLALAAWPSLSMLIL